MMNANELRPGNYFKTTLSRDRGEAFVVVKVDAESNQVSCGGIYWYHMENVRPVRLTQEWLAKLGANEGHIEIPANPKYKFAHDIYLNYDVERGEFTISTGDAEGYLSIRYVHQLQNLYFALTGNELEIK